MKVIETNISFSYIKEISDFFVKIKDHQSRIIDISDWDSYIKYYLDPMNDKWRKAFPDTLPHWAEIINLQYDKYHLFCIINNGNFLTYRLAYLMED